jgi:hypothetical protein
VEMRFGVAGLRNALAVLAQGLSKAN